MTLPLIFTFQNDRRISENCFYFFSLIPYIPLYFQFFSLIEILIFECCVSVNKKHCLVLQCFKNQPI